MTDLPTLRRILAVAYRSGEPQHIPSALGILPIVATLYDSIMGVSPEDWDQPGRDCFILSKGHGALALYAVLEQHGFITANEFDCIGKPGSILGGHPTRDIPGVWASTGSLGHGLPIAVGLAYAKKVRNEDGKVYCLISDGEAQEGSIWESFRLTRQLGLRNLCVLVEDNGTHGHPHWSQCLGSFGFETSVLLSTKPDDIAERLLSMPLTAPRAVVIRTTKGEGVEMMEREPQAWHRKIPSPEQYREIMEGLA